MNLRILAILLTGLMPCAAGQDFSKPDPLNQVVTLDLVNRSVKDLGPLPFDQGVLFVATFNEKLLTDKPKNTRIFVNQPFYIYYKEGKCPRGCLNPTLPCPDMGYYKRGGSGFLRPDTLYGIPTQMYLFFGGDTVIRGDSFYRHNHFKSNLRYCLKILQDSTCANHSLEPNSLRIDAHTTSSVSDFLKLDIGLGYATKAQSIFGIVSAHFYFSPVNDDGDIKLILGDPKMLFKRLSLFFSLAPFVAFTWADQEIKPLPGLGNFGFGIGWRSAVYGYNRIEPTNLSNQSIWLKRHFQALRVNLGVLHYGQLSVDPTATKPIPKWSPMVTATYSFGIAALLGPLVKLFQ